MVKRNELQIDRIIHQPIRTKIFAYMASKEKVSFVFIKNKLEISDGNLATHMQKIVQAGYAKVEKKTICNNTQTTYSLTQLGKQAFSNYIRELIELLKEN